MFCNLTLGFWLFISFIILIDSYILFLLSLYFFGYNLSLGLFVKGDLVLVFVCSLIKSVIKEDSV